MMKPKTNLLHPIIAIIFAFSMFACINTLKSTKPIIPKGDTSQPDSSTLAGSQAKPKTIKIGSFNIQNLGVTKMGKADVVKELVTIIRKYDVIAIQEISDITNNIAYRLLDSINQNQTIQYKVLVSQRTGQQADDITNQEQYAFYYNTSTIKDLDQSMLYNDSTHDYFCREPFLAHFKVNKGNFSFVICTVHTKPEAALEEIGSLNEVIKWAKIKYAGEDDFIVLGDFNASCTYVTPVQLKVLDIRKKSYQWIIADSVKTNLSSKQCAYDRIVITSPSTSKDFDGKWGVDRCFTSKMISDHWPVWAEFYTTKDTR